MKRLILIPLIILIIVLTGCTADDPGFSTVVGNPEAILVDSDGDPLSVDSATRAVTTIEYEHHKIHDGDSYLVNVISHDLDVGDTLDLTVITANTVKWMHTQWDAEGILAIHIFVYEDAVTNVAGAVLTPVNMHRNSTNTASGVFRDGDTFNDLGDILWEWHTGSKKGMGEASSRQELILRQGSQYLFRIESEIINNEVTGLLTFYEHTNKD